jgi:DNA excision repair protein ERCC-8
LSSLLTGGADASIHLWDLNVPESSSQLIYKPLITAPRSEHMHANGITSLSFYPFDNGAVLSSSYDHSLKISSTHTLIPTASFPIGSVIHTHAMSPIGQHVLVACATQSSIVRLVDLKSGSMVQGLLGHQGDVLNVAWSPTLEHVLASSGRDGTVRLWDIRRSANCVGMLDLEDETGILARNGERMWGRAHVGPCNAVAWTPDGNTVVTAGHDERIRVWDITTGRNTLVHFGPTIRNQKLAAVTPVIVAVGGRETLLWPNEKEIIIGDLMEGRILKRLRPRGAIIAQGHKGTRTVRERVTGIAWRDSGYIEAYSAHADGVVRAWLPSGHIEDDESESEEIVDDETSKKRKALEELHRELTRQKITFS